MKIISFVQSLLDPRGVMSEQSDNAAWVRDPLAHPALGVMSQRELGDLPFNRDYRSCGFAQESCR
ncbi:hypothetical protein [Mesorhizobium sp. KR1-2]|uniref:hypothetical protein n=1 Tax=Mesorhizobium sp. KR1-2 TaxID=3156609 RepID=UPI0032B38439